MRQDTSRQNIQKISRLEKLKTIRLKALGNFNKNASAMKSCYDKNRVEAPKFQLGDLLMVQRTPLISPMGS